MRLINSLLIVALCIGLAACANQSPRYQQQANKKDAARANTNLGVEYMRQGDYPRALTKFRKALDQDPYLADAHGGIALLYQQLEEYGEAETHFKRALSLSDHEPGLVNNYAVFQCSQNRHKDALKNFVKAATDLRYLSPEAAYTNAGVCALRIPDLEAAENYLRQALQRNPQYPEALLQMAQIFYDRGDHLRVQAFIQRYEAQGSESPQMLLLAMRNERQLGNDQEAARYEARLRTRYPEIPTE